MSFGLWALLILSFCNLLQFQPVSSQQHLLDLIRSSLKRNMQCPSYSTSDRTDPVIALTPARYLQFIATVRHDANDPPCGFTVGWHFVLLLPATWSSCTGGVCPPGGKKCHCFDGFTNWNCESFNSYCWLMYCHLEGCRKGEVVQLVCVCDESLYGKPVTSGEYWYDWKIEDKFFAPEGGYTSRTRRIESRLITRKKGAFSVNGADIQRYMSRGTVVRPQLNIVPHVVDLPHAPFIANTPPPPQDRKQTANNGAYPANLKNAETGSSNLQNPEPGSPNLQNSEAGLPNFQKPVAGSPNFQKPVAGSPNFQKPVAGSPNVANQQEGQQAIPVPQVIPNAGNVPAGHVPEEYFPDEQGDIFNSLSK